MDTTAELKNNIETLKHAKDERVNKVKEAVKESHRNRHRQTEQRVRS